MIMSTLFCDRSMVSKTGHDGSLTPHMHALAHSARDALLHFAQLYCPCIRMNQPTEQMARQSQAPRVPVGKTILTDPART